MSLINDKKFQQVNDISRRFMCVADPEIKKLALSYNADISDEARQLHKETLIVDCCANGLEDWNWHLEEAGVSALNLTVPGTHDSTGDAMGAIINFFGTLNEYSEKLMHVRTVEDIYEARRLSKTGVIFGARS